MHLVGDCSLGRRDLYLPQGRGGWVQKVLVKSLRKTRNREKWTTPQSELRKRWSSPITGQAPTAQHRPTQPLRAPAIPGSDLVLPARPEPPGEPNGRRPPWRCPGHRGPAMSRCDNFTEGSRSRSQVYSLLNTRGSGGNRLGADRKGRGWCFL